MRNGMRHLFFSVFLVAAVLSTSCTYMHNRGKDAMQMFDIGITVSPFSRPGLAVYGGVPGSIAVGGAYVPDAKLFGIGNNQAGWLDYEHRSYGLAVWGSSRQGAGTFDANDVYQARDDQRDLTERPRFNTGPVRSIVQDNAVPLPAWIECDKFVHVGYVGIVFNCRFLQILDFLAGWTTLDIMGDDNVKTGS
jgi:hypothetical protein